MDNEAKLDRLTGCNSVRRIGGGPTDDVLRVISTIDCIADFYVFMNIVLIMYNRLKQVGSSRFLSLIRLMKLGTNASNLRRDPTRSNEISRRTKSRNRTLSRMYFITAIRGNAFYPKNSLVPWSTWTHRTELKEEWTKRKQKDERNDMEKCIGFQESCAHVRWTLSIGSPCFRVHGYERSRRRH